MEFYSDSCVPCKRVSPLLAQIEEDYGDRLLVGKVNAPFARELTEQHNVLSTPDIPVSQRRTGEGAGDRCH
ncbi:MAG: thioredoxin family protein [Clostridiales bacterium]|nr:thioredoxin family protein [Clostridiales bacterium]